MSPARFKVGDRVTMRRPEHLPAGTVGTVTHVCVAVPERYYVGFGDHGLALLWASELDRIVDAPRADRRRTTAAD